MKKLYLLLSMAVLQFTAYSQLEISEVRVHSNSNSNDADYIELKGVPGSSIPANYRVISIGESPSNPGEVRARVQNIAGEVIPADGFYTIGFSASINPDLQTSEANFNGFHSMAILLIEASSFIFSSDNIDEDDDGVVDNILWENLIDGIQLAEKTNAELQDEIAGSGSRSAPWDYSTELGIPALYGQVGGNKTIFHAYKDPISGLWKEGWNGDVADAGNVFESFSMANHSFISSSVALSSDAQVTNLTVESDGILTISSDISLSVGGDITNDGSITFESGSSLVETGASYSGNAIIFKRTSQHSMDALRHNLVGSPVAGFSLESLNAADYFTYEEASNTWLRETGNPTMTPGQGYSVVGKTDLEFSGTPNSGMVSVSATASAFKMLANPYPCAVNIDQFFSENNAALSSETLWLWNDGGSEGGERPVSDYITINSLGEVQSGGTGSKSSSNFISGSIGSSQGFFVQTSASGTAINFTDAMKQVGNNTDDAFFRNANSEISKVKLSLKNDHHFSEVLLGFLEEASSGLDKRYDAEKFKGTTSIQLGIVNDDMILAIAGYSPLDGDKRSIDLEFTVETDGVYSFELDAKNLSAEYQILIHDKQQNVYKSFVDNKFEFFSSAGTFADRFSLIISPNQVLGFPSALTEKVQFSISNNFLTIKTDLSVKNVNIYDLQGRMVLINEGLDFSGNTATVKGDFKKGVTYVIKLDDQYASKFMILPN
ncbi:MAG: hypothetical protein AAF616_12850 [Bacteroidota bacterium]